MVKPKKRGLKIQYLILDYAYLNMWKLKRGSNYIILGYADMVKLKEKIFKKLAYNIRLYNIGFVKIINN